jgi:pimeloyl-ACP methyl ester carboxylesterase
MRQITGYGGVQIAYDALGSGAPIAMLHDLGESSGFWLESGYVERCLAHGRRVILIDLRGHGASGKPVEAAAYGLYQWSADVLAVLNDAGIGRADLLGYGLGGRIALCLAGVAPNRLHAACVGGAHPFSEPAQPCGEALSKGLDSWIKLVEAKAGGISPDRRQRLKANDPAALLHAVRCEQPDMAEALAASGVPLLLFVGKDDPRYPLALSFADEAGAKLIGLAGHDHASALAAGLELLPQILEFFERPEQWTPGDGLPLGLWSGSWT